MTRFIDYIETSCKNLEKTDAVYRYKRQVLEEMKAKAKEISAAGLKDEKVIADLITNEFGNVGENFTEYEKKKKRKKLLKTVLPIGSLGFILLTLIAFFAVSAATDAWNKTWLIVVGGVFALVIFLMILAVRKLCRMRRVFHPIARMLIVACTILISVFAFLYLLIMTPTELPVWPAIPAGVILALAGDLIFAFTTKQKLRTISLFVYMPAIATMFYVIFAAYKIVTWSAGWPIILLGLAVDIAYIIYIIMSNMKYFTYKQEVEE